MRLKNNDEVQVKLFGIGDKAPVGVVWGQDEYSRALVCFDYDQVRQFQFPDGNWPGGIRQFSGRSARIVVVLAIENYDLQLKNGRAT